MWKSESTFRHEKAAELIYLADLLLHPFLVYIMLPAMDMDWIFSMSFFITMIWIVLSFGVWIPMTIQFIVEAVHFNEYNMRTQIALWNSAATVHICLFLVLAISSGCWMWFCTILIYRVHCTEKMELFRKEMKDRVAFLMQFLDNNRENLPEVPIVAGGQARATLRGARNG